MDAQFVPILVFGFATSLGLTPVSRQIAFRLGVIDRPKKRNITKAPTPMMGGFAIYMAFALSLFLFSPPQHMVEFGAVITGATFLAFIGVVDDRYDLGIRIKLVVMTISAIVVLVTGIQIELFSQPIIDFPLTILWIVAVTNAVNFLDNMDGLAAGLSTIGAFFFMIIAVSQELSLVSALSAAVLGSAAGFLSYNFKPASSFMGDMGALPLGFVLAILGIKLEFGSQPLGVTWIIPILVLALPIFDINLVVFTRLLEGRSPGEAGKDHTSHRLMSMGFSDRKTLLILYGACTLFGTMGFLIGIMPKENAGRLGIFCLSLLLVLFVLMMWIRRKYQLKPASQ